MKLIFESLNQCEVTLAGTDAQILFQRYTVFRHLRSINKALSPARVPLNSSKDDGIFISTCPVAPPHISSVLGAQTLKTALTSGSPCGGCGKVTTNTILIRVYEWLISPGRTSDTTNDRLRSLTSFFLFFLNGGKGADFFTCFSTSFPLAGSDFNK